MYWDRTGTGINTGPKLTPGGSPSANSLNIDGDSIVTIQADTNARFRVGDASTPDLILDITPTVVSSSVPITGSALHTNSGITIATGGGDLTFLSDQGKVTAGSIEMVAGGSDVLNFNDNSISGSGNISGSAFYGDGSNLTGIGGESLSFFRWNYTSNIGSTTTTFLTSTEDASGTAYDGSTRRWRFPYSGSISFVTIEDAGYGTGQFEVFMQKIDSSNSVTLVGQSTGSTGDAGSGTLNVTGSCDCSGDNTLTTGSFAFGAGEFFTITVTNREHTDNGNLLIAPRGLVAFSLNPANKL